MKIYRLHFIAALIAIISATARADTIPDISMPLRWHIGAQAGISAVPRSNLFLKGFNPENKKIRTNAGISLRFGFEFNENSHTGQLYKGVYQGIGIGVNSFFSNELLGTPTSVYVYQGAPIVHFSSRLWLGYEWQFGAAFGWKHSTEDFPENNVAVSTGTTAQMGLGVKLNYILSAHWQLALGINATHFSNGNTSWPNAGINTTGASIGVAYMLNPASDNNTGTEIITDETTEPQWFFDITAFGAWRKRIVNTGEQQQICPGKFGVAGLQFSPLRRLNRFVAVGPALDFQWDESGGLSPYRVEGTEGENIRFYRPPFGKQLYLGLSAHAELTMPIFSVNAGLGYDFLCPEGDKRFYQSLTLKTFITLNVFLNVGYRLGSFKDPQNLMLGVGVRL